MSFHPSSNLCVPTLRQVLLDILTTRMWRRQHFYSHGNGFLMRDTDNEQKIDHFKQKVVLYRL